MNLLLVRTKIAIQTKQRYEHYFFKSKMFDTEFIILFHMLPLYFLLTSLHLLSFIHLLTTKHNIQQMKHIFV